MDRKIPLIKAIRDIGGLDLKTAKAYADHIEGVTYAGEAFDYIIRQRDALDQENRKLKLVISRFLRS